MTDTPAVDTAEADGCAQPFRSRIMTVEDEWTDYNGHLNMAYYNVLFDRAIDDLHLAVGLGEAYRARTNASTFTAEAHIVYLREIHAGDEVQVTCHLLGADAKRHHTFMELIHVGEGFVSANSEQMHLHVELAGKRVVPWPEDVRRRLETMSRAHEALPRSDDIGRVIGMRRSRG